MLDDNIQLHDDGHFTLRGRYDRIVKVEEKRLSLDELEHALNQSNWVKESHTLVLGNKRERIAAIIVLTEAGQEYCRQQSRVILIKKLRKQLMADFETVVLPRKWLVMQTMPLSEQGKIKSELLRQLLMLNVTKFPQIQSLKLQKDQAVLQLRIPENLLYFMGHFPQQAILPGVTQLAWVEKYGRLLLGIDQPFLRMEVIKFKKIIRPGDIISVQLQWKATTGKLYFELSSDADSHSSGRMVYGVMA